MREGHGQRRLCHDCIQTPLGAIGEPNVFPGLARAAQVVSHQKMTNAQKAPERKRVRRDQLPSKSNDLSQDNIEDATVKSLLPPQMDMKLIARDEHCMFRALAISEHVVQHWDDITDVYAEWIRIMHKHETTETYKIRMLGTHKGRGNFPELSAAAAILQRHIEIFEYVAGETDLKWEEIMAPGSIRDRQWTKFAVGTYWK